MTNFQQFFILGVGFNYAEMIKNVTLLYGPQIDSSQHIIIKRERGREIPRTLFIKTQNIMTIRS